MDSIELLFKAKVNFVAYREVDIVKAKKEKNDPHFGINALKCLGIGLFSVAFDTIKYGSKTSNTYEIIFKYFEFIDVEGKTYYAYEDLEGYRTLCKLLNAEDDNQVKNSNLTVLKGINNKTARMCKLENLEKEISGRIYRLADCDIYLWEKLGTKQFLDWWGQEKADDKYYFKNSDYFLEKNNDFCDKLCESELRKCRLQWEKVYADIDQNKRLVDDLKNDLWEVKLSYKKAIERAEKKIHDIEKKRKKDFVNQEKLEKEEFNRREEDLIKRAGEIGEERVQYALKWLPSEYIVIRDENNERNGIHIRNDKYIDEIQEIDHIVIGPQGVFLIETKNYAGKITIEKSGNWIREREYGRIEGERNPLEQIRRHEKLVKSIVPDVAVISILCLAHPKVILIGEENFPIKIVKSDLLCEFIEKYQGETQLSQSEIQEISIKIQEKMVK